MTTLTIPARDADSWWLDCATRALVHLAAQGRDFDAYDLTLMGVPDPDHTCRWGSLFAAAKAEGIVVPVGYRPSSRPGRSGGVCRVWRGTQTQPAAPGGGSER